MNEINLQNKTSTQKGIIETYWFENKSIGLQKTLFYKICTPLSPFNTGLSYGSQPLETEIVFEWLNLKLREPDNLNQLKLVSSPDDGMEISIYLGAVHNFCQIKQMNFKKLSKRLYEVDCKLFINFENEDVAKNETFNFVTELKMHKKKPV